MPQTIMDVLRLGRCSHEFSWPRRAADGDYYQICTLCAAEYKYDWSTMRRTERVQPVKPETGIKRSHQREKRPLWKPRARRIRTELALRYRVNRTGTWYEGMVENISQTGILFQGPQPLPVNALIEMVFEMPEEISGQKDRSVVCQGRVIRVDPKDQARRHNDAVNNEAADNESSHNESTNNDAGNNEATAGGEKLASGASAPVPCNFAASIVDYKFIR